MSARGPVWGWLIVAGMVALVGFAAYGAERARGERERCVRKGVAFYKEVGSYPRLTTGELADSAAVRKCAEATHAFGR